MRGRVSISVLVLGGALLASALGACSHEGAVASGKPSRGNMVASGNLYGNYLAGRIAGEQRDAGQAAAFFTQALKRDPTNDILLDRTFLLELTDGQIETAFRHAEDILAQDDKKRLPQMVLGLRAVKTGDFADARRRLAVASNGPFNSLATRLIVAWCDEGEGHTDAALAELKLIEQVGTFDVFRLFHTALILDHAGRTEEADKTFRKVIDNGGNGALRIVDAYGRFLARQGRSADAISLYRTYSESQPDNPLIMASLERVQSGKKVSPLAATPAEGVAEVLYGLASALANDRSVDLPIVYLQLSLYLRPDFDVARTLIADLFETLERYDSANAAYALVPKSSPLALNAEIQTALNLDRMGKTDEAVSQLKALSRRKDAGLRIFVSLGDLLRSHERFPEAVEAYDRAIAQLSDLQHQHWSLFYARGVSLERAGRWPEAERDLRKALALDPDQPLVLNYLGYSWIEKGERLNEALRMINRAVDLMPNDGYVVDSLGWADYKLGQYDSALVNLERAVNLRPDDPTINDHLGDIYWRVGRQLEARYQWKRAIALGADKSIVPAIQHKIDYGLGAEPGPASNLGNAS
jgi:tetratricopeptide (TPR) repeat protein